MAELTSLQRERIAFHLNFVRAKYLLSIARDAIILTLADEQILAVVGQPILDLEPEEIFTFQGTPLCSNTSLLGNVERAFQKLSPDTIEDSLYVAQAGSVTLRGTELRKREELYKNAVKWLGQLIGTSQNQRVGWSQ